MLGLWEAFWALQETNKNGTFAWPSLDLNMLPVWICFHSPVLGKSYPMEQYPPRVPKCPPLLAFPLGCLTGPPKVENFGEEGQDAHSSPLVSYIFSSSPSCTLQQHEGMGFPFFPCGRFPWEKSLFIVRTTHFACQRQNILCLHFFYNYPHESKISECLSQNRWKLLFTDRQYRKE